MASPSGRDADGTLSASFGGRPTEGRRLLPRGRETIARLLDAGRDTIAERGFPDLRVDDVADRAGTSHGTFYLYFADKHDLLAALMRRCTAALRALGDRLPEVGADDAGRRRLRAWLADFHDVYAQHGPVLDAWLARGGLRTEAAAIEDGALDQLKNALAARIAAAGDTDLDADMAALALVAMIERFTYFIGQDPADRDRGLDTLAAIAHRGVFSAR